MKKTLVFTMALAALVALSGVSYADAVKANTGCGLGTQLWQGKNGIAAQFFAMTTNGTCYNQTFGISSGTLGCQPFSGLVFNSKVDAFIAGNMDNLANDIAKGNGEYLDTLAVLMDVDAAQRNAFNVALQNNFKNIYTSESVTSDEVKRNIEKVFNS